MLLGRRAASNVGTSVTVNVTLPTITAGKVEISVLARGETVPKTITVDYPAEPISDPPSRVEITTNVDRRDTIHVDYLEPRDVITVYSAETGGKRLAHGRVRNGNDEIMLSHRQLTDKDGKGGYVWITVTSMGKHESGRIKFKVPNETKSDELTSDEIEDNITITNGINRRGIVEVRGLEPGDAIAIFNENDRRIGGGRVSRSRDFVRINTNQLRVSKEGSDELFIKMTVKRNNERPSEMFNVTYDEQPKSPEPTDANNITVDYKRNPTGTNDAVNIDGLEAGDQVRLYANATTTSVLARGTVGANRTDVTLSRASFAREDLEVTLFISVARRNMLESNRIPVVMSRVVAKPSEDALANANITITNNAGIQGTIFVSGIHEGVTITAYSEQTNGRTLGTARVAAAGNSATISLNLGRSNGEVWLTAREPGFAESGRKRVAFLAQATSETAGILTKNGLPDYNNVAIVNNVGAPDTITISGNIREGDNIRAYASNTTGTVLGQITAGPQDHSVTITIGQLGRDGGTVYLSIINRGNLESARIPFVFEPEMSSFPIIATNSSVRNNTNSAPTIEVWGLNSGDVITVYDAANGGRTLGRGTVDTYATSVTFNLSSLNIDGQFVWVTRRSIGLSESARTAVGYDQKLTQSTQIDASDITIFNHAGIRDEIIVNNVAANEIIRVYSSHNAANPIAEGTVRSGTNTITLTVDQLGTGNGTVHISVTRPGQSESLRTAKGYAAEQVSTIPDDIDVRKRETSAVIIDIEGLGFGDIIRVYRDETGSTLLSSGSAGSNGRVTITLNQLGTSDGNVFITRISVQTSTSARMYESARYSVYYGSVQQQ
jgi:hypothetical protein